MRYFYADDSDRMVGPVSGREVMRLMRDGVLTPDSRLMVDGAHHWQTVGTLVEDRTDHAEYSPSDRRVCEHCNSRVSKVSPWCPTCRRSTRAHVDAKLAPPSKRLAAQFIDWLAPSVGMGMIARTTIGTSAFPVLRTMAIIIWAIWSMTLFSNGMTPGKWLLDLYVIDESGDTASFIRMLIREFIGKPISFLFLGLGYLWIVIDDNHQGWHDKLVDTYVVED